MDFGIGFIQPRQQELIELVGLNPEDGFFFCNQALFDHVERNAHGGASGALAVARLQHVEPAFHDCELEILHVTVVFFQPRGNLAQLLVNARHGAVQFRNGKRCANAGDHIFALRIHQILAIKLFRAGGRIAGKAHARAAGFTQVAKHHALHAGGRTHVIGNLVHAPVVPRAFVVPGTEDGVARHGELLQRRLREVFTRMLANNFLVVFDNLFQCFGIEIGIQLGAAALFLLFKGIVELTLGNLQHDIAKHVNEPPIRVVSKTRIVAASRQRLHAAVVQAQIEDGIHHSRHGSLRSGAYAHQQWVVAGAQLAPFHRLQTRQRFAHLAFNLWRQLAAIAHIFAACFGLNGKARRHRKAGIGHLSQARAFTAQFGLHVFVAIGFPAAKEIYITPERR